MKVTSPVFEEDEILPEKYCSTRENINPPLIFEDIPDETESLVLIMDDPDAKEASGKVWEHWTVWNIPVEKEKIQEDWEPKQATEGKTDFPKNGYGGPNPPEGKHEGRFKVFAVDKKLELDEDSRKRDVYETIKGHVIDQASLEAVFEPV